MNTLKEIWEYRTMIVNMVRRDLKGKYRGSVLGFFWTFLTPLLQLVVYTLVFSVIMRAGIEDYYLFLFVTLIPWSYFSNCLSIGSGCIVNQKDLVVKIYFPREVLPISHVLAQLANMLLTFLVLIAVLLISGKGINLMVWGYLIIVIFVETLLALGMTFLLSAITVFIRDLQYLMTIVVMAWQFLTPVMYSVDMVPENLRKLFYLNPMTPIIIAYRDIFYYKQAPQLSTLLLGTFMGVFFMVFGFFVFTKLKKRFAEVM
ncbi:MAG: ABC transporter permease [Lachnospiraceae bacterium]|nr:ABC transporter permease [Lachnospiraceae bacterium]